MFAKHFVTSVLALWLGGQYSEPSLAGQPGRSGEDSAAGISGVTRGPVDLVEPSDSPPGANWRYGLIAPLQIAPRKAAALVNIRFRDGVLAPGEGDYEIGVDFVLFDRMNALDANSAVVLTRNHQQPNPNSNPPGEAAVMIKYPCRGGFVPLGAKRADGSDHPHAGTGFGIVVSIARRLGGVNPLMAGRSFRGEEFFQQFEIHQLEFDGEQLSIVSTETLGMEEILPGWHITNSGLSAGVADGDDLLVGMVGGKRADCQGSGVMRFRRTSGAWRPTSFVLVTGDDESMEPSLIRDVDGSLLFSARGTNEPEHFDIRVWRSSDGGVAWTKTIHARGAISIAPIVLNQAADGTPYIASNIYLVPTQRLPDRFLKRIPDDDEGRYLLGGWTRQKLYLWPLTKDRRHLKQPILARDCRSEFGDPPGESMWRVDHPMAATVQLADGKWRNLLGYRIHEDAESPELQPPPQTGAYLEEVISTGPAIGAWKF